MAADLGITENEMRARLRCLTDRGYLQRIGSVAVRRTPQGVKKLVVWQIPEEKLERIGAEIGGFPEVLYADRRPSYPDFPFSFYTWIRASTDAELEVAARRMQDRMGRWPHQELKTVREFKKDAIRYFPKALEVWWQHSRSAVETAFQ